MAFHRFKSQNNNLNLCSTCLIINSVLSQRIDSKPLTDRIFVFEYYTNPNYYDFFELVKCHLRHPSSWLSLLQILHIDLLAYTSLFSMFAGLAIFFILT